MRPSDLFFLPVLVLFSAMSRATDSRIVIDGCEGEGCQCFTGYPAQDDPKGERDIKTIRPFKLYQDMDKGSKRLGEYRAGVLGKPLGKKLIIHERGEYLVERVIAPKVSLKKGDRLDTLLYLGEGFMEARKNGQEVGFEDGDIELKTIKKTRVSEWLQVMIGGKAGFTQDSPFEYCLE